MGALAEDRRFTAEEFVVWNLEQSERYELIAGRPVRMMTGARRAHRQCVANISFELTSQLRGGPCVPTTHDAAVKTGADRSWNAMTARSIRTPCSSPSHA